MDPLDSILNILANASFAGGAVLIIWGFLSRRLVSREELDNCLKEYNRVRKDRDRLRRRYEAEYDTEETEAQ